MTSGRAQRPSPRLLAAAALAAAAAAAWFGLGMHRGLLLSSDVKSRCWPWAATYPIGAELQAPVISDPVWQFVPWLRLARRELAAGRLPLWNPHQDGGEPLLANYLSALASPLVVPVLLLGVENGWNLSLLLRLLAAGTGMYLLLRDAGRSPLGATLGGVVVALSGPFIAWLENPNTLVVAVVPWLLLAIRRMAAGVTRLRVAGVATATFGVLTGGHAETALFAGVLALAMLLAQARPAPRRAAACGAAVLGALFAAPVLLPFTEYFLGSAARVGHARAPFVLSLASLVRFVAPSSAVDNPVTGAATVSVVGLLLALLGAALWRWDREAFVWVGAAAAVLLVTYDNPLARVLATATPVFWTRALILLPLPLAALASAGLDAVREIAGRRLGRRGAGAIAVALATGATAELLLAARGVHAVTAVAAVAPATPLLDALAADHDVFRVLPLGPVLPPNAATDYGLDDVRGYDALAPRGWRAARESIGRFTAAPAVNDAMLPADLASGGRGLDGWNVKYLLLPPGAGTTVGRLGSDLRLDLEVVYTGADGVILRNRRVLPRVRLLGGGDAAVVARDATRWAVRTASRSDAVLEVANPYFPGWRAQVDGRDAAISAAPGEPIRVALPAGPHEVVLRYRPWSFVAGVLLALLGAVALSAWVVLLPPSRAS
jgi:hypothetical protein